MIEKDFDIPFIADLALREKQIQQNYRPIIAVHKWFARRPGTLFRGLLLAEFSQSPLRESFYRANQFPGVRVADPFMGGGTPLLEANRLGCDITGFDINPMAYWIVKQEIDHLDISAYMDSANSIRETLENDIGHLYRTRCIFCGSDGASVKYFLWVKVTRCHDCMEDIDLFPGYLIAGDSRHPKNVFICPACGQLTESDDRKAPGSCQHCRARLSADGPARRNRIACPKCGSANTYPNPSLGSPRHRLFAMEYHCPSCRQTHRGRYFKAPDSDDLSRVHDAEEKWRKMRPRYVPDDVIPSGDETNRLHRWGYKHYREMFNPRQLLGLELLARLIGHMPNETVRNALATNLSDLLRYQNMLCRYDTMALKSLDIFSVHGFPVGLIQCESNLLGIMDPGRNACIGSGGWANIIEKYQKAKSYCQQPYEVRYQGSWKEIVPVSGEWIGDRHDSGSAERKRIVDIRCEDASRVKIPKGSLDAVFTDPPYFGNVQYAELMDFCYVWLRRLVGDPTPAFQKPSTRDPQELTGNEDMGRGLDHFADGLSSVFQRMAKALKPGSPLAFTYHHNDLNSYYPVAVAILDSGLTCSASLPCPAEMGASIHINGTGSSIIDTVFVCRSTGSVPRKWIVQSAEEVARLVMEDLSSLRAGNVHPTLGDTRCIAYGHLIRLAVWGLRKGWNKDEQVGSRMKKVAGWLQAFGDWPEVEKCLRDPDSPEYGGPLFAVRESPRRYGAEHADIPF
jgi:adenine-specific DNA methylase